jgi:hypothetical protein
MENHYIYMLERITKATDTTESVLIALKWAAPDSDWTFAVGTVGSCVVCVCAGFKVSALRSATSKVAFIMMLSREYGGVGAQKELLTSDGSEEVMYVKFQNMMYLCRP